MREEKKDDRGRRHIFCCEWAVLSRDVDEEE
jgi:hypothetical protein